MDFGGEICNDEFDDFLLANGDYLLANRCTKG
jgi:hypothetical protein